MIPGKSVNKSKDFVLEKEARLFARYLLDCDPPREMVDRYISANRHLGLNVVTAENEHISNFSLSHPWSIPFLDAATGFLQPEAALRKKIYIMAAVLEASPRYAKDFLPDNLSPLLLFVRLITNGLTAGIKILVGLPMFLIIRRSKND